MGSYAREMRELHSSRINDLELRLDHLRSVKGAHEEFLRTTGLDAAEASYRRQSVERTGRSIVLLEEDLREWESGMERMASREDRDRQ